MRESAKGPGEGAVMETVTGKQDGSKPEDHYHGDQEAVEER